MRFELWKCALILIVAGLLGYLLGLALPALLITSLLLLIRQWYRVNRLYRWVRNPGGENFNPANGQFYLLHSYLNRRFSKERARNRQLSAHLSQFRKAASAIPDAIVLLEANGKIEWANVNASHLLGIEWPRDRGLRFTDLVRDPAVTKLLNRPGPAPQGIDIRLPARHNQTLSVKCVHYGDQLRMIVARDVSRLMKINQMHTDFVANVSHELRTPLTVLKGYLEILSEHPDVTTGLEMPIEQMSLQATRMENLVQDLIYLAKLEELPDRGDHQRVDVSNLVSGVIESIQPLIELKRHTIETDIDDRLMLLGNSAELHSALSNLLENAAKYTDESGKISIRWNEGTQSQGGILCVSDNGIGIPSAAIPSLTKRFFRVDDDRSREGGGTGLGLAIVKHVLQRHNARLEIHSLPGKGSEFRCLFPPQQIIHETKTPTEELV